MLLARLEEIGLLGVQIRLKSEEDHVQVGGAKIDKIVTRRSVTVVPCTSVAS